MLCGTYSDDRGGRWRRHHATQTARVPGALVAVMLGVTLGLCASAVPAGAAGERAGPDDAYWPQQWALEQIGASSAWPLSTGEGVRIGIVDTGIDLTHEDLADKVVASTNCVGSNGDPAACSGSAQDVDGHGTLVSGVAAADTNNERGIAGVAPGARLVVARALAQSGPVPVGTPADTNAAVKWVVDHGARVVNLSLGVTGGSGRASGSALGPGFDYAWSHGAIPVVASGNLSAETPADGDAGYAGYNVVVVGATGRDGAVAPYSRPSPSVRWGVVAPGGSGGEPTDPGFAAANILSTAPSRIVHSGYAYAAGTSLAAPHVSGALALLLAQGLSPLGAVQRLIATTDSSRPCGAGCRGSIDVGRAVGATNTTADPAPAAGAPAPPAAPAPAEQPPTATIGAAPPAPPADVPTPEPVAVADPAVGSGIGDPRVPVEVRAPLAASISWMPPRPEAQTPGAIVLVIAACPLLCGAVVRRWARRGP